MRKEKEKAWNNTVQVTKQVRANHNVAFRKIVKDHHKFLDENQSVLSEAAREQKVLRMKRGFLRRGWQWPPKTHRHVTVVHLINNYYGEEVCKHLPQDELERKVDNSIDN